MHIKLFEDYNSGVNYDVTISSKLKDEVGNLDNLSPYVLELGGVPPLSISESIQGRVHVIDSKGDIIRVFKSIDSFLQECGRPIKLK